MTQSDQELYQLALVRRARQLTTVAPDIPERLVHHRLLMASRCLDKLLELLEPGPLRPACVPPVSPD